MGSLGFSLLVYAIAAAAAVLGIWAMIKLIAWAKGMSTGAYLTLAIFPLISLFPIPPTEIKKMERIKQEQVKQKEESGEPPNKQSPEIKD